MGFKTRLESILAPFFNFGTKLKSSFWIDSEAVAGQEGGGDLDRRASGVVEGVADFCLPQEISEFGGVEPILVKE